MTTRILSSSVAICIGLLCPSLAASAATPEQRCKAAKSRIVGAYVLCVEKAAAKSVLKEIRADTEKCEAEFVEKWQKAEARGGGACPDGVDAGPMRQLLAQCIADASAIIDGQSKVPSCGDNAVNVAGEQCDGDDVGDASCERLGFSGGSVSCTRRCLLDTSGCTSSSCEPSVAGYEAPAGCSCRDTWTYNDKTICHGGCANPDGDPSGPWCFTTASCSGQNWAYCQESTSDPQCAAGVHGYQPPSGCACKTTWAYAGKTYCNAQCANPDGDSNGPWCFTSATCNGANFAYCSQ